MVDSLPTQLKDNDSPIIIVGAGPVGLLIALRLAQNNIKTLVLEAHPELLPATRAMVYMPVVIPLLKNLGIFQRVQQEAYLNRQGVVWRDVRGEKLGQLHLSDDSDGEFGGVLLLGQAKMHAILLEELSNHKCVEVMFGMRCVGIEELPDQQAVQVMVHRQGYDEMDVLLQGRYVIGTDGANSAVRRALCVPFDGFTYQDWNLIGCDVICDLEDRMGWAPLNFACDPTDFCVIAFTGQDEQSRACKSANGLWRFAYPESPTLSMKNEDVKKRAGQRIATWLKEGVEFKVLRAEPYVLQQRVARQARKGKVLLAGDALHSNNPMGGLGLTSGICDAYAYGNALVRVIKEGESDSLLTSCAESRRQTWINTTDKLSQANLKRMFCFDSETVAARESFFKKLKSEPGFHGLVRGGFDKLLADSFESS